MSLQNEGFSWDNSERGHSCEDFFPPVEIPIITHTPWVQRNIPIPLGIYDQVCNIIRTKMDTGVYEHSNSLYHSCWFCVVKKEADAIRPVHSLEPLNAIMIQHSSITPFTKQIAEQFAGHACEECSTCMSDMTNALSLKHPATTPLSRHHMAPFISPNS